MGTNWWKNYGICYSMIKYQKIHEDLDLAGCEKSSFSGGCQIKNCYFNVYGGPESDFWESTICVLIFHTKITQDM